jgi:hypothetical protein
MDRADLETPRAREICAELNALVGELQELGLRASNWYGALEGYGLLADWERANRGPGYEPLTDAADDERYPWFLYWEIAWLDMHNDFRAGQRLLDLGGSSSLFSCWMAARGLDVVTVDLNEKLVANADALAAETGWSLRNVHMDMRDLDHAKLGGQFDHVTSVCVFEHIPVAGRIDVGSRIRDLLAPGGSFSITFDYENPAPLAQIGSPADVTAQFLAFPGLEARGNREFYDNGLRYLRHQLLPGEYTFGALFQQRAE